MVSSHKTVRAVATFVAAGIAGLFATPVAANFEGLTEAEIAVYDTNNTENIEKGREATELLKNPGLSTDQRALVQFGVLERPAGVPVVEIARASATDEARCNVDRRLRLRSGLNEFSLTAPNLDANALSGADFSFSHDGVSGLESWTAKGALFWVLGDPCIGSKTKSDGTYLSRYGFAPFWDFEGSRIANVTQPSKLRAGAVAEFQVANAALFPIQVFRVAPYYRTDFYGEADVYGLNASWTPYNLKALLKGRINSDPQNSAEFFWEFHVVADVLSVQDGGRTGLISGQEHAWLGVNLGGSYTFQPEGTNGFFGSVKVSAFQDLANSDSAEHVTATLGAFVNKSKTSALVITHKRGTPYTTLQNEELTTVGLSLKF